LFREALKRWNLYPDEVIHIGDSLISVIKGAQNVGIKAVWLNRKGKKKPENIVPDYICKDLLEVAQTIFK
jgi:2-haloacid dehalogenase/putative hydrolase of the HAD superfamily